MSLYQEEDFDATQKQFIINYLDSMWSQVVQENSKSIFFNMQEQDFEAQLVQYSEGFKGQATILKERLTAAQQHVPYYPFLKFIKQHLKNNPQLDITDYVSKADIYQLHKPLFISFFQSNYASRSEELILEELQYEQQQMLTSIINLVVELTAELGPLVIIIEGLEKAGVATLKLIQELISNQYQAPIMFLFSLDKRYRVLMSGKRKKDWDNFIKIVETENILINLNQQGELKQALKKKKKEDLPLQELIELGSNCLNFLALEEAKTCLETAHNRYQSQNINLDSEMYIKLLTKLGDVYNYLDKNDAALINYQAMAEYLKDEGFLAKLATAYRKIAQIHFKKYNLETAVDLIDKSLKLVQKEGTKKDRFLTYFSICLIQERKKDYNPQQWEELYNKTVPLGKELGMYNTLACFYNHFHYIYYIEVVEENNQQAVNNLEELGEKEGNKDNNNRLMESTYYKEILKLAQEYNNQYRLAAAYQLKAVIYAGEAKKDEVLKYYNKSKELKEELGIKRELAYVYNGLGHHYFTQENYQQAYRYHNQALKSLREVKDYHEIAITCLNQGLNLFFARESQLSILYLTELLDILRVLQLDTLMYQSQEKLYSLLGINYLKTDNFAKAEECMLKLKFEARDKSSGDILEPFFIELFTALYYKAQDDYQRAKNYFSQALFLLNNVNYDVDYVYPRFYYEYGLMYNKFNQHKRAQKMLKLGLEYCEKLDYKYYKNLILQQLGHQRTVTEFEFEEFNFDFDWIAEAAELEETLNKFHNQMSRVKFLNRVQNILVETASKETLINRIMKLIDYKFLVKNNNLFLQEGETWKNCFTSDENFLKRIKVNELIEKLAATGEAKLINGSKDSCEIKNIIGDFNSLLFIPLLRQEKVTGCLLFCTGSGDLELTTDDLQILSILGQQLTNALERIEKDEELKQAYEELQDSYEEVLKLSKTDFLTGLYNRFELIKKLKQEKNRIERYQNYSPNYYSVMYIDLDNFKYYNDQFGHNIGDLVLRNFAELLEAETRNVDFVSRFGGDEFVIALPETKAVHSYNVAKRIQNELVVREQFKAEIESELGITVKIPDNKKLTCSIGIAENCPNNDLSNDKLLQQADHVLYNAKQEGKNKIKIWID